VKARRPYPPGSVPPRDARGPSTSALTSRSWSTTSAACSARKAFHGQQSGVAWPCTHQIHTTTTRSAPEQRDARTPPRPPTDADAATHPVQHPPKGSHKTATLREVGKPLFDPIADPAQERPLRSPKDSSIAASMRARTYRGERRRRPFRRHRDHQRRTIDNRRQDAGRELEVIHHVDRNSAGGRGISDPTIHVRIIRSGYDNHRTDHVRFGEGARFPRELTVSDPCGEATA
jgi:hypothetical protein